MKNVMHAWAKVRINSAEDPVEVTVAYELTVSLSVSLQGSLSHQHKLCISADLRLTFVDPDVSVFSLCV